MYDYALVHCFYTIPPAVVLTLALKPLCTRLDLYKILFLATVAFTYSVPWDAYLIKNGIWTYPPDSIIGPKLLGIPAEELFFFVIQTYITTVLQVLLTKPVLLATYLHNEDSTKSSIHLSPRKWLGIGALALSFFWSTTPNRNHGEGTYMKLIIVWASPVLLFLWSLSYQLLLTLPRSKTWLPIWAPTLYLWLVDTLALRRGTWSISTGTKLGIYVWPHLEIEEAMFFLLTNTLVVWGACAFDNAIAILDIFPDRFPKVPGTPSPLLMMKSLLLPSSSYDQNRLDGLRIALVVLAKKSRSFYLASGVFSGRLRIDLVLLYSFCRVADDLIDDAPNTEEADRWIRNFSTFLDVVYSEKKSEKALEDALTPFPPDAQSVLRLLPTEKLPSKPLYSLLDGFRIDLGFMGKEKKRSAPIKTIDDLERYASCVAATIGELCLSLVYYHDPDQHSHDVARKANCVAAGARMGRALQYINIARDVTTDAAVGRCYIPEKWLQENNSESVDDLAPEKLTSLRKRIVDMAFRIYAEERDAIEDLPAYARDGIRVAVESYVEIGRVLDQRIREGKPLDFAGGGKKGRASVPKLRRVWVGYKAMTGVRGSTGDVEAT